MRATMKSILDFIQRYERMQDYDPLESYGARLFALEEQVAEIAAKGAGGAAGRVPLTPATAH